MALTKAAARADVSIALRARVVDLFRRACRSAEHVSKLYELTFSPAEVRHLVNLQFKKHAHIRDPRVIDMLVVKGEMELEETLKQWKQRPHVLQLLEVGESEQTNIAEGAGDATVEQGLVVACVRAAEEDAGVAHDGDRAAAAAKAARLLEWRGPSSFGAPSIDQTMPLSLPGAKDMVEDAIRSRDSWRVAERHLAGTKLGHDTLPVYVSGAHDESSVPTWAREAGEDAETLSFRDPNLAAAVADAVTSTHLLDQRARDIEGDITAALVEPASREARAKLPVWVAAKVLQDTEQPFSEAAGLYASDDPAEIEARAARERKDAQENESVFQDLRQRQALFQKLFQDRKTLAGIEIE